MHTEQGDAQDEVVLGRLASCRSPADTIVRAHGSLWRAGRLSGASRHKLRGPARTGRRQASL